MMREKVLAEGGEQFRLLAARFHHTAIEQRAVLVKNQRAKLIARVES
jgi:hypothetical protein